ncbi:MAG: LD-carboxypeptidase [Odoribacter sp.]|nr:LD-carboxypeptidase [Odoribacter sp.]
MRHRRFYSLLLATTFIFLPMVNCSSSTTDTTPADREAAATTDTTRQTVIYPAPLVKGDKIAIVSPAGPIDRNIVDNAAAEIRRRGFTPVVYPHTYGRRGYLSGTADERFADLEAALTDTTVKAILCSRGGYGVVHNLDRLATLPLRENAKWIIGFSDISALHALMSANNIASVHSSMAKAIMLGDKDPNNAIIFDILTGKMPTYTFKPSEFNHTGSVTGRLLGGNLAVIADLINTPFDIIRPGTILFIEDVSEPIYKIERIIYQLKLSGVLDRLSGLIIGQFTEYKPDGVHTSMEEMISRLVKDCDFPIAFGIPVGHVDYNVPLVESSQASLIVTPEKVTLSLSPLKQ